MSCVAPLVEGLFMRAACRLSRVPGGFACKLEPMEKEHLLLLCKFPGKFRILCSSPNICCISHESCAAGGHHTPIPDVKDFLAYIAASTNMKCLTLLSALSSSCCGMPVCVLRTLQAAKCECVLIIVQVAINTTIPDVKDFLAHIVASTNMKCLTPPSALSGSCGFLAANLYAKSVFGEDALVNLSVEKGADAKLSGYIRIRCMPYLCEFRCLQGASMCTIWQ